MNKTIIVTGANGNLGKAVVSVFLAHGWNVIGLIRKETERNSLPVHEKLDLRVVDLMEEKAVIELVETLIREYKTIEAGILTAGGFRMGNPGNTGSELLQQQIDLNFKTAYHVCRPLFLHMINNNSGRIIFIGSRPALEPQRAKSALAYGLSKSLLFTLSDILNKEAAGTNVASSVIVPDTIDTPENRREMPDADTSHWVKPEKIAEIMAFITSDTAAPLRGGVFKVYG